MTNDYYAGFLKLNKDTATKVLYLLNEVLLGKMKPIRAHCEVCQIIGRITDHIAGSEERRIIFLPLCTLCQEVKERIALKME